MRQAMKQSSLGVVVVLVRRCACRARWKIDERKEFGILTMTSAGVSSAEATSTVCWRAVGGTLRGRDAFSMTSGAVVVDDVTGEVTVSGELFGRGITVDVVDTVAIDWELRGLAGRLGDLVWTLRDGGIAGAAGGYGRNGLISGGYGKYGPSSSSVGCAAGGANERGRAAGGWLR